MPPAGRAPGQPALAARPTGTEACFMRTRIVGLLALAAAGFAALSLLRGQERPPPPASRPPLPADAAPAALKPVRDFSKLEGLPRDMLLAAQRGADWLSRMNTVKGRFA